jgi:predicted glutamine amidotransferase
MCRLFGLNAGRSRIKATFWLLDAPDSLEAQGRRNVDGSGIGYFGPAGTAVIDKEPEPAFDDQDFIHAAKDCESETFVAHVRLASAGGRTLANTHPFTMGNRIFAHNGGFGDLPAVEQRLGGYLSMVQGDTDSERFFALITKETDARGGDVAAGITAAASWLGANVPVASLNLVLAQPGELWALRYPGQHALHVLAREPAGGLSARSVTSSYHSADLSDTASVLVASEELDGETGWRMLGSGELIHVRSDLRIESLTAVPEPPAQLIPIGPDNPNVDT